VRSSLSGFFMGLFDIYFFIAHYVAVYLHARPVKLANGIDNV
jgi:hypothetical protein